MSPPASASQMLPEEEAQLVSILGPACPAVGSDLEAKGNKDWTSNEGAKGSRNEKARFEWREQENT